METIEIAGANYFGAWDKVRVACRGIVVKDGLILLNYETKTDQWMIPGGGIENEEDEKESVKANILKLLKDAYDIEEDDFLSAELEIVPAAKARDLGLDRSMVIAYGQDDRVCAYPAFTAIFAVLV